MTPIEKAAAYVVEIAKKEVGYREKASNSQLDDKTANAGSSNYTKYAAYFDNLWNSGIKWYNTRKQTGDWCDMWFDWCQCQAWGYEIARKVLYQPMESCGAGCEFSADYYRANGAWIPRNGTPKIGDQIFFGPVGDETHTGMVVGVTETTVFTIEGNYGNRCAERTYDRSESKIAGYGRPDYSIVAYIFEEEDMTRDETTNLFNELINPIGKKLDELDEKIDTLLGPMITSYKDVPWKGVKPAVRWMLDNGIIDGGTDYEKNPDDIGFPLQLLRVLICADRDAKKRVEDLEDSIPCRRDDNVE